MPKENSSELQKNLGLLINFLNKNPKEVKSEEGRVYIRSDNLANKKLEGKNDEIEDFDEISQEDKLKKVKQEAKAKLQKSSIFQQGELRNDAKKISLVAVVAGVFVFSVFKIVPTIFGKIGELFRNILRFLFQDFA